MNSSISFLRLLIKLTLPYSIGFKIADAIRKTGTTKNGSRTRMFLGQHFASQNSHSVLLSQECLLQLNCQLQVEQRSGFGGTNFSYIRFHSSGDFLIGRPSVQCRYFRTQSIRRIHPYRTMNQLSCVGALSVYCICCRITKPFFTSLAKDKFLVCRMNTFSVHPLRVLDHSDCSSSSSLFIPTDNLKKKLVPREVSFYCVEFYPFRIVQRDV